MGKKNIIQIDVYGEQKRNSLQYITTIKCFINLIPGIVYPKNWSKKEVGKFNVVIY